MEYLDFIKKGKKVYHVVNGWGEVTSGEYGTDFQVRFPNIREIQSYKADGTDYEGINRAIYEDEVFVREKRTGYGLCATITEDGAVDLNFQGVNNSEILQIIDSLMEIVVQKELSSGNTSENLIKMIEGLSLVMVQSLLQNES